MDVELILNKMQEMNLIRLSRRTGNYYQVYCPIHNNGQEKKPSCGVLLQSEYRNGRNYPQGFVHCFSCSWAKSLPDTITEILKNKNIGKSGLDWLTENIPGFEAEEVDFDFLIPQNVFQSLQASYAVDYINSKIIQGLKIKK